MPNIYIIDDIPDKCEFVPLVFAQLVAKSPEQNWSISNKEAVDQSNIQDLVSNITSDQDSLLLLDIELKNIRCDSVLAALQQGNSEIIEKFNLIWNSLGSLPDYAITCSFLAYCNYFSIPAFVISTRPNDVGRPLSALCLQSPECVIENWPDSPHVDNLVPRASDIAERVIGRWNAMRGKNPLIRLWQQRILDQAWFKSNSIVPHNYSGTPNNHITEYLDQIFYPNAAKPTYDLFFHEVLKTLIGSSARAHFGGREYLPYLSTFALLAAIWDCDPMSYLAGIEWQNAGCRILPETATKEDIVSVIATIAAPNGLFDHCLVDKTTNTSQVEDVKCLENEVSIKLKWLAPGAKNSKLGAETENIADARLAIDSDTEPLNGESRKALWRANQVLESKMALIKMEISDAGELIFRKK